MVIMFMIIIILIMVDHGCTVWMNELMLMPMIMLYLITSDTSIRPNGDGDVHLVFV